MQDFELRRRNLFEMLGNEEKKLKGTILEQTSSYENVDRPRHFNRKRKDMDSAFEAERLIGRESIFKKPDQPIQKCLKPRVVPDYTKNPHKWTRYTLADADISENANTSAALAFLQEIEKRKEMKEYKIEERSNEAHDSSEPPKQADDSAEPSKIVFNKTSSLKRSVRRSDQELEDVDTQTPKFKSSTIVMPEYVVGQKPIKDKKPRMDKKQRGEKQLKSSKELKLTHLLEYDDDGENEGD